MTVNQLRKSLLAAPYEKVRLLRKLNQLRQVRTRGMRNGKALR